MNFETVKKTLEDKNIKFWIFNCKDGTKYIELENSVEIWFCPDGTFDEIINTRYGWD